MNLTETAQTARRIMNAHGLGHVPFEFDGGKRRIGCTHFSAHNGRVTKITLSRHWAEILSDEEIHDVILHEVAHALAGHAAGHGVSWKSIAIQVGAKPERCKAPAQTLDTYAWRGKCPNGHDASRMHRAPRRVRSCSTCNPVFDSRYILSWTFNGVPMDIEQMPEGYRSDFFRSQRKMVFNYSY